MAAKKLVVVESPAKAGTIEKYLGKDFEVKASKGHVKDLPRSRMGVDPDADFEPQYETVQGKGNVLQELRKAAKQAETVYLAPDPDREGEAIAWHVAEELKVPDERIKRVLFNEITRSGVQEALEHPRSLDEDRYNSQQARRILDRLVGYQISPLLWDKVRRGLSAGRVQSVAVRIVVEREREIEAFQPQEYWTVDASLAKEGVEPPSFPAKLRLLAPEGDKAEWLQGERAKQVAEEARHGTWRVREVTKQDRRQQPQPPFTTSRLQQEAARRLRFTAHRTMRVAQRLYEGVELGNEGAVGLITYMRTDSTRLSDEAVKGARAFIAERYGNAYVPKKPRSYQTKGRSQDAHEAIRPTSLSYPPDKVRPWLDDEAYRLYELIWKRFVACQMTPAVYAQTRVDIEVLGGADGRPAGAGQGTIESHVFRASGSVKTFDGFTRVYEEHKSEDAKDDATVDRRGRRAGHGTERDGTRLPPLEEGDELSLESVEPNQHFTQPPPRFTEATLVRELEEKGIGRPSTYAQIISVIQDKGYVEKQKSRFRPTELGRVVNDLLVEAFPELFDIGFTARMEDRLDRVEEGEVHWKDLLQEFWGGLSETLETAKSQMRRIKGEETPTELSCPRCEGQLVIKFGKRGSFLACSSYPDCKYTAEFTRDEQGRVQPVEEERFADTCPKCQQGELVYRRGRFGRFIGCTRYPDCRHTQPIPTGVDCPRCDEGELVEKSSKKGRVFYSCSRYPDCEYAQRDEPAPVRCPTCGHASMNRPKRRGKGQESLVCPSCSHEEAEAAAG